ncbi:AraC family transcriptional regulator [Enterococcus sp. LJL90]
MIKDLKTNFQDLYFAFCGHAKTYPKHSFGPAVRDVYLVHVILSGAGYYTFNETKYFLKAGDGFIIPPGVPTFYQADSEKPWTYIWMGIGGSQVQHYMEKMGFTSDHLSFQTNNVSDFSATVFKALAYEQDTIANELALQQTAYQFLEMMFRASHLKTQKLETKKMNSYVSQALEIINQDAFYTIAVSEIADTLAVHPSHLSRLFKKDIGISIKEYITELRLSVGNDLLSTTKRSVQEISELLGFASLQAFSKAFKKRNGLTPSAYRKMRDGLGREN